MEASKQQVRMLLESLRTEKRTDVMSKLNSWFVEKSRKVANEVEQLSTIEDESVRQDEELARAHSEVERELEEKEMQSFQVLNRFYKVLHGMGQRKKAPE